jgi:hypothetical protein
MLLQPCIVSTAERLALLLLLSRVQHVLLLLQHTSA